MRLRPKPAQTAIGTSMQMKSSLAWGPSCWRQRAQKLLAAIASVATILLPLAGCSGGVLEPQGPIGAADNKILLNALGIMLVIVVPTIVAALAFA